MKVWIEMKPWLFLFKVSTRHIINKLFFDIAPEEDGTPVDPESLQVMPLNLFNAQILKG